MSGRRRTIFFLVMLLAVLVLLTGQVRGEDRRSLGPLGTGVLTALAPLQTVMARVADSLSPGRPPPRRLAAAPPPAWSAAPPPRGSPLSSWTGAAPTGSCATARSSPRRARGAVGSRRRPSRHGAGCSPIRAAPAAGSA